MNISAKYDYTTGGEGLTIQELEQLHDMRREIKVLKKRIEKEAATMAVDSVTASGDDYPYTPHQVTIRGMPIKLIRRLRKRTMKLEKRVLAVETFIDTIEDSQVRQIVMMRYSQGMTWQQVAMRLGSCNEATPRKMVSRYFGRE